MKNLCLALTLLVSCQVEQQVSDPAAKTYDVEGKQWTRKTDDSPGASINPLFVPYSTITFLPFLRVESPTSECIAFDVEADAYQRWLNDKVNDLINNRADLKVFKVRLERATSNDDKRQEVEKWLFKTFLDAGLAKRERDYRRPSIIDNGAKILCVSWYDRGRGEAVNMFSLWDGQKASRVGCHKESGDFVCRDLNAQELWRSSDFVDVESEIRQASFTEVTKGRVKIVNQTLLPKHRAFFPFNATEINEYKFSKSGHKKNFDKVTSVKTDEEVLISCKDGFRNEAVCRELGIKNHACLYRGAEAEHKMCKLQGRGMLIKYRENDVLLVKNCEYHKQAQHFFCSDADTVYFERYGARVFKESIEPSRAEVNQQLPVDNERYPETVD